MKGYLDQTCKCNCLIPLKSLDNRHHKCNVFLTVFQGKTTRRTSGTGGARRDIGEGQRADADGIASRAIKGVVNVKAQTQHDHQFLCPRPDSIYVARGAATGFLTSTRCRVACVSQNCSAMRGLPLSPSALRGEGGGMPKSGYRTRAQ